MTKRLSPELDLADQKLIREVEEHGWGVITIAESNGLPGWAFSIGLYHNFRHPELVVFGLASDLMQRIVNILGEDIQSGTMYDSGFEYADVLEGVRCIFHSVNKNWYPLFLGYATWFYEGEDFPVLQCIWPDKQQNFPWSSKFPLRVLDAQPWLFHSDLRDARVERFLRSSYGNEAIDNLLTDFEKSPGPASMTFSCKEHDFKPEEWPFEQPRRIIACTSGDISKSIAPVLSVFHENHGMWLFFSSDSVEEAEPVETCLGCLFKSDPSIGDIADLPCGWGARRKDPKEAWRRRPIGT